MTAWRDDMAQHGMALRTRIIKRQVMRKILLTTLSLWAAASMAQSAGDIVLNQPDMKRGNSIMQTLAYRHSTRECNGKALSAADLSDLLWAANGVNRADGKRTAPSALNRQDIDIYVVMESGAYLYDAKSHKLVLVAKGDHRGLVAGGQDFVRSFPVSLVMVSDLSRFGKTDDRTRLMAAVDAGAVSQNISLFCSGCGLVTVPRASMDYDGLTKLLKLKPSQLLLMNNPVGYAK